MSIRVFIGVIGAVLVIVGFVLLETPVSTTVTGETGTCEPDQAFGGAPPGILFNNQAYEEFQDRCADAVGTRHDWSWGLVGTGAVIGRWRVTWSGARHGCTIRTMF